jgi:hypothetical protein
VDEEREDFEGFQEWKAPTTGGKRSMTPN